MTESTLAPFSDGSTYPPFASGSSSGSSITSLQDLASIGGTSNPPLNMTSGSDEAVQVEIASTGNDWACFTATDGAVGRSANFGCDGGTTFIDQTWNSTSGKVVIRTKKGGTMRIVAQFSCPSGYLARWYLGEGGSRIDQLSSGLLRIATASSQIEIDGILFTTGADKTSSDSGTESQVHFGTTKSQRYIGGVWYDVSMTATP